MIKFAMAGCFLLCTTLSFAGSRDSAREAIAQLPKTAPSTKLLEEIASIRESFSNAEEYARRGYHEQAERYYLLSIQKSRILMSSLPAQTDSASERTSSQTGQKTPLNPAVTTDTTQKTTEKAQSLPEVNDQSAITAESPTQPELEYLQETINSEKLVGNANVYVVKKKESLKLIAAKLGVTRQHLIQLNNLDPKEPCRAGQKLVYNNRKIIPLHVRNGIVINIPDRTLYYFKDGKLASSLPVALGVAKKNRKFDWTTPVGKFRIVAKQKNPTWFVPKSIQAEMEQMGKEPITSVPPGPRNPLGKFAMKTSLPGILIHSTTKPGSIYSFASHGCIRVYPEQMEDFFKVVRVNTPGEIIYNPVKLAVTEDGRVFLEVHQDIYRKKVGLQEMAKQLIEKHNITDKVDWKKVETVVKRKAGLAEDISL